MEQERQARKKQPSAAKLEMASKIPILMDLDGTLDDTERQRLEVAFWELAPYLPNAKDTNALSNQALSEFIKNNAGTRFEVLLEKIEQKRVLESLDPVEKVRASG